MSELRMESQPATYNIDDDVDILLDLLWDKFQQVPEECERLIGDASVEQIKTWSLRTLSEPDIGTVFETRLSPSPQSEPDWEHLRQTGLDMGTLAAGFFLNGIRNGRLISKLHGEKYGVVCLLLSMLHAKFMRSPEGHEQQILDASVEQVKAWGRRLLSEPNIDAVFETSCASFPSHNQSRRDMWVGQTIMRMESLATGLFIDSERRGAVDMFLEVLYEKFQRVPKKRQWQVRAAELEQIKSWCLPLFWATDIDEVFELREKYEKGEKLED